MFRSILILSIIVLRSITSLDKDSGALDELELRYEDEKNSMIALKYPDEKRAEDLYDELDNKMVLLNSMDILFFGPPSSFLRLDAESILHILSYTKKELIPISRVLLAWDIITDGKTSAYLQGRELAAFGSLLDHIPEEDLFYINIADTSVFRYFANSNVDINDRTFGILIASYRRYFGYDWYKRSDYINDLGYLLCGFPTSDLRKISPKTFKNMNTDALSKLDRCTVEQMKILYNIATHPDAYGEPFTWNSHELGKLNILINCIPQNQISSLRLEAIPAITPEVMKDINQKILEYFSIQQISRMNEKSRRIFILRVQLKNSLDTSQVKKYADSINPCGITLVGSLIVFLFN